METTRQQKIARMLEKELGEIFLLYAKKLHGTLITVTGVKISPDLSIARAYLSIFPVDKKAEVMPTVEADTKSIRFDLGKRVKNQLRIIPELYFHLDESLDYLENIDNLLKSDPVKHPEDFDYGMDKYEK
ncbi:MAG: 30S ribosome-binding factor RbfA [Paludibacteraceae bacterium]